ncbi:MAG: bifunctional riboflavin kinase/FAD synthetase [Gammaproteobacteria bacterium]
MKIIRGLHNLTSRYQHAVITIGTFDGMHIGHQQLLAHVIEQANKLFVPSVLVTFEPQPAEFLAQPQAGRPRLMRLAEKLRYVSQTALDAVLVLAFNHALAELVADDFVKKVIVESLMARAVIVGDDFHFGYQRQGDISLLKKLGKHYRFSVMALPTIEVAGERASSSRVRDSLLSGNLSLAQQLLGRNYSLSGRVTQGAQLGSQLGFPTANIHIKREYCALNGVYAVKVYGLQQNALSAVANIGRRPTVDGLRLTLEVHILNFHENIYGRYLEIEFLHKLRDEQKFASIDMLKQQIAHDVQQAQDFFTEGNSHERLQKHS